MSEAVTSTAATVVTPTTATPAAATQVTAIERYKVKIDGVDSDVDRETLIRDYQSSQSANKKFREAADTRAQAEEVLNLFKNNPKKAFEKLGVDAKAFAEMILNEHMQDEMLSPDQRQMRDYKNQLDQLTAEKKQQTDAAQKAEDTRMQEHYTQEYDKQFTDALATSGLPKNANTIRSMAYYMKIALENGYSDVTPAQVIGYVKKDYQDSIKELFGTADENTLASFLGDDLIKKVIRGDLAKHKGIVKKNVVVDNSPARKATKAPKISPSEYFKRLKKGEI